MSTPQAAVATADRPGPGPATGLAIATHGLTKRFGDVAAVDGVDLTVPVGSVFGFLGPNGSGKTTTIRMLLGLISPSAGTWELLGEAMPGAAPGALARVGALIEGPAFYPWLTGHQNLSRLDAAGPDGQRPTRKQRIGEALARVGLTAAAGKKYRAYSLGMRQRLGLAAALLRPRDLLILDEPTNGMDPQGTREIRHLITELAGEGATIFLSSHLLSEIEQVCTHAGVMTLGRLITQGTMTDIRAAGTARLRLEVDRPADAAAVLGRLGLTDVVHDDMVATGSGIVTAVLGDVAPELCCRELVHADIGVRGLSVVRPSLEELFVELTGEGFDVAR